jgi:endonuclease-3
LERGEEALGRLLSHYEGRWRQKSRDPFRSLVRTILSQNTSYKNEEMAYKRLEASIGITPSNLANVSVEKIADAIRPAGMFNKRGRTLKALAEAIIEQYGGEIGPVLEKPYTDAREELMGLPGVGPKTADVLLMFDAGKEVIPVDRHIFRITKRLRLVPEKATYDDVRHALQKAAPPGRHIDVHVLLIRFGRELCRALKPRCHECFLLDICPYPKENKAS